MLMIARPMGRRSTRMTERYAHLTDKKLPTAVELVETSGPNN